MESEEMKKWQRRGSMASYSNGIKDFLSQNPVKYKTHNETDGKITRRVSGSLQVFRQKANTYKDPEVGLYSPVTSPGYAIDGMGHTCLVA